jgi:halimadienyl-diphosphate synthase
MLLRDPFELVGFELIFPTLLMEARAQGLDVPTHACGYGEIQTAKLRLIPLEMLYSPRISTVHSLEFMGQAGDIQRMRAALATNGSLGNSPATTAYYLLQNGEDREALGYLGSMLQEIPQVIYLYPFRTFELTWVLKNLSFCNVPIVDLAEPAQWESLKSEMSQEGIGLDKTFGIPDGDITSVCTQLLIQAGNDLPPSILERFENKETHTFRTYDYERNVSVGTNVHALEALDLLEDYPNRQEVQEQLLVMLLNNRKYNIYWIDKWHTSPYYATAHVLMGLLKRGSYLAHACRNTIDWLLHTQRKDGSWGFFEIGTPEETAYALIALMHYTQYEKVDSDILRRGIDYLERSYESLDLDHPELWIGKCLYMPYDIVRSAVLTSLILYDEIF